MAEKKDNSTRTAFLLNLTFTILEIIGGLISGSIAILTDSLHDFADSLSLGAGWYFEEKSKKGSSENYSYGYARFSLLGAMINAVTLFLGSIFVVYASVNRIMSPEMPNVSWMIGISVMGVALNGIGAWKLKSGKSMNKQVMKIHLLEDTLGWIAVFIGSIILLFFNIPILDPILAITINLVVLVFATSKLIQAIKILLQKVPEEINLPELKQKILSLDKVKEVSHLHVWSLTEETIVVTVHISVTDTISYEETEVVKKQIKRIFDDLSTEHITIDIHKPKDIFVKV